MQKTLAENLDTSRARLSGVKINVNEAESHAASILYGGMMVVFGICVFYLLPYSLLHLSIGLLLGLFFAVLFGMIGGLVLLAFNLESMIEILFVQVFLFWENQSIR